MPKAPAPSKPAESPLRLETGADWVGFWIHVTPRARTESVAGCQGDALRVAVKAPPVDGKANQACRALLAKSLGLPRAAIDLDPGARGRRKRVRVHSAPLPLAERLHTLASRP